MRRIGPVLLAAAAACSSSSKPEPARPTPVKSEREEIEAARPASQLTTERTAGFRPAEQCGQGPYRLQAEALSARYGERLFVYACGPRSVSGNYRLTTIEPASQPSVSESSFGFQRDNQACVAGAGEAIAQSARMGGGGAGSPGESGARAAPGAARASGPVVLASAVVPADCARTQVLDSTFVMEGDGVPLAPGTRFALDIWSDTPNDLTGMVFVIEQQAVRRDMTPERWAVHRQADRAWTERYLAYIHREVAAGRTTLIDTSVKSPPPPPRRAETPPPRPTVHARWVPGYWQPEGGDFRWVAGFWRVPASEVPRKTVAAAPPPKQPPPPRPRSVAADAGGHWHWDGRIYLWIDGGLTLGIGGR